MFFLRVIINSIFFVYTLTFRQKHYHWGPNKQIFRHASFSPARVLKSHFWVYLWRFGYLFSFPLNTLCERMFEKEEIFMIILKVLIVVYLKSNLWMTIIKQYLTIFHWFALRDNKMMTWGWKRLWVIYYGDNFYDS